MSKPSFRIYLIEHHDGRCTGHLMCHRSGPLERPAPSAYGRDLAEVEEGLEIKLSEALLRNEDRIERYLFTESFETRRVKVEVQPISFVDKQPVIGHRRIPLSLRYACCQVEGGAYRVMLPRFGWWMILEDLEDAPEALRAAISSDLLGTDPGWVYDYRNEVDERVIEWRPDLLSGASAREPEGGAAEREAERPVLASVAEELTDRAARGKLPKIVGDDPAFDRLLRLALPERPPSILLVGGSGVGKTTWVYRLARHYMRLRREEPEGAAPRIYSTSAERLVAGMIYVGMWQERCLALVDELAFEGDYLHLDRLTGILRGQPDGGSIAELLAAPIQGEEISVIAECTESELARCQRRFPALISAFEIVRVPEPSAARMPTLLALYQERQHGRPIQPGALKRISRYLDGFQRHHRFPGKGFRFLDWLAQRGQPGDRAEPLTPAEASAAFADYTGLPVELISDELPAGSEHITEALRARVIGQDEACRVAASVLARFKAGMDDPERPLASLLFVGPTGVGKTELAKQIARYLFGSEERMIRLDMSEYLTPGSAQRLMRVGRGIRSLAESVRGQPLSLILLDEIEKAHPEVFDLLLGILGEGRLTDSLGRLIDFRMTLIVMTSNLGVRERPQVGFGGEREERFESYVRQHFRPELFNRIDRVISFRRLPPEALARIVDLELDKAARRAGFLKRRIALVVEPEARALLGELGYHPTRGARPLKRVIEERVITPIAVRIASRPSLRDHTFRVVVEEAPEALPSGPPTGTGPSEDRIVIAR